MNKFHAKKVTIDGMVFDSKREYYRFEELKEMLENEELDFLERQVKFQILPKQKGERKVEYIADFVYIEKETKTLVIEDVKSKVTKKDPYYILKRKLLKFVYINEPSLVGLHYHELLKNRKFEKAEFREVL